MPWNSEDKSRFTKAEGSGKDWASIANAILRKEKDEGKAIRIANAQMKKGKNG